MSNPRDRLLQLARQTGASLTRLSELIGRNPTYLQQFIRKGSPRRLEERDRRVLAEYFGVPESELGGDDGHALDKSYAPRARLPLDGTWIDVPRLALAASAGPGATAVEERPFDTFRFSRRWLREQGLDGAMLSAIAVEGDSMEPLLRAGDEVLVDKTPHPFRDGIHVVRMDDSLLVKRVAAQGKGRLLLLSENRAYPPIEVAGGEVEIVGRVVWKAGRI
jgi:phage repressor protein C with HTH and peptisase S24 domain